MMPALNTRDVVCRYKDLPGRGERKIRCRSILPHHHRTNLTAASLSPTRLPRLTPSSGTAVPYQPFPQFNYVTLCFRDGMADYTDKFRLHPDFGTQHPH